MNGTVKFTYIDTVSANYSWDKGNPSVGDNTQTLTTPPSTEIAQYVGYAPFVSVQLSSTSVPATSSAFIKHSISFGDFYNNRDTDQVSLLSGTAFFEHVYVMPGTYTIKFTEKEYVYVPNPVFLPKTTYVAAKDLKTEIDREAATIYRWKDYVCSRGLVPEGSPRTWGDFTFQNPLAQDGANQLTWETAKSCPDILEQIRWQWDRLVCEQIYGKKTYDLSWNDTKQSNKNEKTWNEVVSGCTADQYVLSALAVTSVTKTAVVKVLEITPTAYLSANQSPNPNTLVSPMEIRMTPKFTKAGSFPIDRIVWDLGDGSPLLTKRRTDKTFSSPFVYTGALTADPFDPRNFDVVHTYKRVDSTATFYPSVTAYASATDSSDSATITIGPIKFAPVSSANIAFTQSCLEVAGVVYIGEAGDTAAVWRSNN